MAAPMPFDEPVTMATLPCSSRMSFLLRDGSQCRPGGESTGRLTPEMMALLVGRVTILRALAAIAWTSAAASAATITGTVIGEGAHPVAGATVFVVGALPPCTTTSGPDGTFSLACAATGTRSV